MQKDAITPCAFGHAVKVHDVRFTFWVPFLIDISILWSSLNHFNESHPAWSIWHQHSFIIILSGKISNPALFPWLLLSDHYLQYDSCYEKGCHITYIYQKSCTTDLLCSNMLVYIWPVTSKLNCNAQHILQWQ